MNFVKFVRTPFSENTSVQLLLNTVSPEFRTNRPKLYGDCEFPQNLHTRKLGEISVFYAVFKDTCRAKLWLKIWLNAKRHRVSYLLLNKQNIVAIA